MTFLHAKEKLLLSRSSIQAKLLTSPVCSQVRQFVHMLTILLLLFDSLHQITSAVLSLQVLMANFTGEAQYRNHVLGYQRFLRGAPRTPRGLTWLSEWGSNRYAGKLNL